MAVMETKVAAMKAKEAAVMQKMMHDGDTSAAGSNLLARQRRRALRESIRNGSSSGTWKLTRGGMPVNTAEAYDEDDDDDLSELFSMDSWIGSSSGDSSEDGDIE